MSRGITVYMMSTSTCIGTECGRLSATKVPGGGAIARGNGVAQSAPRARRACALAHAATRMTQRMQKLRKMKAICAWSCSKSFLRRSYTWSTVFDIAAAHAQTDISVITKRPPRARQATTLGGRGHQPGTLVHDGTVSIRAPLALSGAAPSGRVRRVCAHRARARRSEAQRRQHTALCACILNCDAGFICTAGPASPTRALVSPRGMRRAPGVVAIREMGKLQIAGGNETAGNLVWMYI